MHYHLSDTTTSIIILSIAIIGSKTDHDSRQLASFAASVLEPSLPTTLTGKLEFFLHNFLHSTFYDEKKFSVLLLQIP